MCEFRKLPMDLLGKSFFKSTFVFFKMCRGGMHGVMLGVSCILCEMMVSVWMVNEKSM
jgi:hypothetical protein